MASKASLNYAVRNNIFKTLKKSVSIHLLAEIKKKVSEEDANSKLKKLE